MMSFSAKSTQETSFHPHSIVRTLNSTLIFQETGHIVIVLWTSYFLGNFDNIHRNMSSINVLFADIYFLYLLEKMKNVDFLCGYKRYYSKKKNSVIRKVKC